MEQTEIWVTSTLDGTEQPSLFYRAKGEKRPLLVALHTWSFNRFNQIETALPYAKENDFNLLLPEFRGANLKENPCCMYACGSDCAKQDIKDAIDYLVQNESIDKDNIFLLGLSGGGHMALLMAGYCPEYFKAIAAFVPISNLSTWAEYSEKYGYKYKEHILACCYNSVSEMIKRSPISYMDKISKANLKIFHGKFDPVVPVSQSIDFYNEIIKKYSDCRIYLDIFDGYHEFDMNLMSCWFSSQYKNQDKLKVTG